MPGIAARSPRDRAAKRVVVDVFAVEPDAVQLTWAALPERELSIEVGDRAVRVTAPPPALLRRRGRRPRPLDPSPAGPGAVSFDGLDPATAYDVVASTAGMARTVVARFRTPAPPPGRLLCRWATISDLHLGERSFGRLGTIVDVDPLPDGWEPYPLRCARAAMAEAEAWGAELIVAKGDLTRDSEPAEFRQAGRLLASATVAVDAILGNHDVRHRVDGAPLIAAEGVPVHVAPGYRDVPGLRIVYGHTPEAADKRGRLGPGDLERIVALASGAGPAAIVVHHPPQRLPLPTHYPPGIRPGQSHQLLAMLARANPSTVVLAGHTHRSRRARHGEITVAEVGSTKDYPGVWAGYTVYEGGICQVVRRISEPSCLAWTESTAEALFGVWRRWSPGSLADRCWTEHWRT